MSSGPSGFRIIADAALFALIAMVVCAIALWIPPGRYQIVLAVGIVAFLFWLCRHPALWRRRVTGAILSAWTTLSAMPTLNLFLQWDDDTFGWLNFSGAGPWFHVAFAVAFSVSFVTTVYAETRSGRRKTGSAGAGRVTASTKSVTQESSGSSQPVQIVNPINSPIQITTAPASSDEPALADRPLDKHWIAASTIVVPRFFRGRKSELRQLREAVDGPNHVVCVVGMAGQGKSALLGRWYYKAGEKLAERKIFWCRPYDVSYSLSRFLADILDWLHDGRFDLSTCPTTQAQVQLLCKTLRSRDVLVVLDGFERWLAGWINRPDAEADQVSPEGCRAADPALDVLLADATSWPQSRLLLTSRALPAVLGNLAHASIASESTAADGKFKGLDSDAALELLQRDLKVSADREQLEPLARQYGFHPFALTVLGNLLTREYGGNVQQWNEENPAGVEADQQLKRLLDRALQPHTESLGLLELIAISENPAPVEMIATVLGQEPAEIRPHLAALQDWDLLEFSGEAADMHALWRRHLLATLQPDRRQEISGQIVDWLLGQPIPPQPQRLEDLQRPLWAVEQLLSANDPQRALGVMSLKVDQGRDLTLQGWLGGFGHHALRVTQYSAMICGYTRLVDSEGRRELRNELAGVYNNRGLAYTDQGELARAMEDFIEALQLCKTLVESEGRRELRNDLAMAYNNQGEAYRLQGDSARAIVDFAEALQLYRTLVHSEGRRELRNELAGAYNNRGAAYYAQNDPARAIEDYAEALKLYRTFMESEDRLELRNDLARVYNNRGAAYRAQGDPARAIEDFAEAIQLRKTLVESEDRRELVGNLADTLHNRALAQMVLQSYDQAREDLDAGAALFDRAVREGRTDLLPSFMQTVAARVFYLDKLGHPGSVVGWLATIAPLLETSAEAFAGNPVWREMAELLAQAVSRSEAELREAGADLQGLRRALGPYLDNRP